MTHIRAMGRVILAIAAAGGLCGAHAQALEGNGGAASPALTASGAAASFDAARTRLFLPRDTRAVSFLTGGIARPPRTSLV